MIGPLFRREQGTSFVELAVMLPVLLVLVLGVLDIGRGFSTYMALTNAAREGARWITIHPADTNGAFGRIYGEASRAGIDNGELTVRFAPTKGVYSAGDEVTVHIQYDHPLLFGALNRSSVPFDIQVTMVVLYSE